MKWHSNITTRMVGYLLAASILPLVVLGFLAFETAKGVVIAQAEAENARVVASFSSYLRLYNDQVEDLAANIAGNEVIGLALQRADAKVANNFESLEMRAQMGRMLNSYVRIKGLVSIDVFSAGGEHFHVGETLSASQVNLNHLGVLLQEAKASATPVLWRGIDSNINVASGQAQVISVVRAIEYFSPATGKSGTVGLLVINLNGEVMRAYLQGVVLVPGMQLMQLDRFGNVMFHSDSAQFGQRLAPELLALIRAKSAVGQFSLNGEDVLMNVSAPDAQRRQRVVITPRQQLIRQINGLALDTLLLIGLGLLISLGIAWNFARTVAAPIRAVSRGFYRLAHRPEALHLALPPRAADGEIGQLVAGYNNHLLALQEQQAMVTELQQSEERRTLTENQLRDSEAQLRAILDEMPVGVFLVDRQERIFLRNRHFIEMFGYTEADTPDMTTWWQLAHPDPAVRQQVKDILKTKRHTTPAGRRTWSPSVHPIRCKNGATLHVEVSGVGTGSEFICTFVDYTQHQAYQLELEDAKNMAEAASRTKSEFLANMSHEIRTPMNGILGMLKLLQYTPLSDQQRDYAHQAQSATRALLGIINDILDFSKVEAGKLELSVEPFLLQDLVSDVSAILLTGQYENRAQLHIALDSGVPAVLMGDALRLRQVLINLVGNALKFTPNGDVWLRVEVVAEVVDVAGVAEGEAAGSAELAFSVRDTGIGIAADKLAYVLEGFSQAESSTTRRFGGTGLGLAISKRLVALMGGDLQVQSQLGAGSCFTFTLRLGVGAPLHSTDALAPSALPAALADPRPAQLPDSLAAVLPLAASQGNRLALQGLKLLLVEDNPLNQRVAVELLRRNGAVVDVAGGGLQGVQMALAGAPGYAAILMDLQMPDMDGFEATRQILADTAGQAVPIIAMTANAMDSDRQACLAAGMVDHVSKPIDVEHLIATLLKHTGHAHGPITEQPMAQPLLLDTDTALRRLGGDPALYGQIVRSFQQEVQAQVAWLQQCVLAQHWQDALRHAHTVKGLSGTVGAVALAAAALQMEQILKAGAEREDALEACMVHMQALLRETLAAMDTQLAAAALAAPPVQSLADPAGDLGPVDLNDLSAASEALVRLMDLLKESNMRSTTEASLLRHRFAEVLGPTVVKMDEAVQKLHFDEALEHAQDLLDRLP
ncbi:MAG: hypothetical protein CFE43_19760 [Burkholderiales bacterium PBB3]|nr:MAG: hypothetical protein CFE43_19760 [Burkholderiales bacterium PBB3]